MTTKTQHKPWFCLRCGRRYTQAEAVALMGNCDWMYENGEVNCGGWLSRMRVS